MFMAVSLAVAETPIPKSLPGSNADPHIVNYDGTYYIYPTAGWAGTIFKAYSSQDLIDWKDEGTIFDFKTDSTWAEGLAWAPCMAAKNGKYYFYYSADKKIGVAVSDSPTGPFVDPLDGPLFDRKDIKSQTIDPMVFIDDDGSAYMYAGSGRCSVVKLNDDMISWDPSQRKALTLENYSEGSFMIKRKGKYYLMWSYHGTRDPRYCVNYGVSDSPMGPFQYAEHNPILSQEGVVKGPGHHSVIQVPDTDEWYIAYHRFGLPGGSQHRETCISPMYFNEDGSIQKVDVFEAVAQNANEDQ